MCSLRKTLLNSQFHIIKVRYMQLIFASNLAFYYIANDKSRIRVSTKGNQHSLSYFLLDLFSSGLRRPTLSTCTIQTGSMIAKASTKYTLSRRRRSSLSNALMRNNGYQFYLRRNQRVRRLDSSFAGTLGVASVNNVLILILAQSARLKSCGRRFFLRY